jgi:CHAT domain-containing protein/cytochrome c-type biogenesis protein CcmH/NrfG
MAGAEQHKLRKYLLGLLTAAEEKQVELRLLSDSDFAEEFDIVVDEITDDYIAGKFEGEEREQVKEYFFQSEARRDKLRFAQALKVRKSELGARKNKKFGFTPYLAIAASLILVAGGFYIWRTISNNSDLNKGLAALQAAYREERPLEARISRFDYAPYSTTRGPGTDRVDQNELQLAELTLRQALKTNPTPALHHGLGKVLLAKKQFDDAIKEFDEALKGDPTNAQLYSDLGVTWFEKGKIDREGKDPGRGTAELGRSLENLSKALELNPDLLEALFNRALSRQHQRLFSQAEADWREYLKRDPSSQWSTEASRNLKLIEEEKLGGATNPQRSLDAFLTAYRTRDDPAAWNIYRRSHSPTGNTITNELIDGLLRDNAEGQQSNSLDVLNYAGQLQLNNAKDPYDLNLARFYGSATARVKASVRQARDEFRSGYVLLRSSKSKEAIELFSRSRDAFGTVGNDGEALLAEYAIAHAANNQPDLKQSELILARIIPICIAKNYKWLLSQCLVDRAYLQSSLSNYSEAIDDSNRALGLSKSIKDYNGIMGSFVQLASLHLALNDSEQSLSFVEQGFAEAAKDRTNSMHPWGMYTAAALNFDNLNLCRAAFDFQNEALSLALNSRVPIYISRSYEYLGLTLGKLQQYEEAIRNVRLAYEQGRSLAADRHGQSMMAHASLMLGDLHRSSGNHSQALDAYNESDTLYDGLGFGEYRYMSHKGKLLTLVGQGNDAGVQQELPIVLKLFEDYREKILEEHQRNVFFDKEQDVYDLAIDFAYVKSSDPKRAFEYSETSRARSLLDLLSSGGLIVEGNGRSDLRVPTKLTESLSADTIKELMPDRVQILQYSVLKDKVVVWYISGSDDLIARSTRIDSSELAGEVAATLKAISSADEGEAARNLGRLYDVLIKPVEDLLKQDKLLCIVPDKELSYLPFAALLSNRSGRYLVQDFRITMSPSASVFIHCTLSAKTKEMSKTERLLSVGNPTFNRDAYPQYPSLVAAEREAEGIAALYTSKRVLVNHEATEESVRAELQRSDVVHLAAHYVIDPQSSLSSKLLLAKPGGRHEEAGQNSGELQAREVCRMDLSRPRLVVLSACQTGIERQFSGEGPTSFARQFLVAGVPLVVASLWPVDDSEATAQLMIAFHRHRRSGVATADALRRAQEEMISSGDARYRRPLYWASFMTIGGYAEF